MRSLNWRVAVVAAALAITGTASAQEGYVLPTANRGYVMSAPTVEAPPAYKHTGKCADCARHFAEHSAGNYWCSNCQNGRNCNNGSGSFKADFGFAFGPSKGFFAPCGPNLLPNCGTGLHRFGCSKCPPTEIYGRGPSAPWSHCTYDSFLNH